MGFTFTMLQSGIRRSGGYKEETYAEETTRYSDFEGALRCLIKDANFVLPPQGELF